MKTEIQEMSQCDGPHRPSPKSLAALVSSIPKQMEIRAVSINGQTGQVTIEAYHDGGEMLFEFNTVEIRL